MEKNQIENKYWGSIEELQRLPSYTENLGKEFPAPPEEQTITEIERRDFLKIMGAGVLLATAACSRRPVEKIIPYVNKPEEIIPGVANYYASTCSECAASCGLLVKTREGRPIKLEGNADHPLNQGALCARGQASILNLYDPDRLKNPVKVARGQGNVQNISWNEVDEEIKNHLAEIRNNGQKVYILTGALTSPSTKKLIEDFAAATGNTQHVSFESIVPEEVMLGQEAAYGQKLTPRYRFDKASLIVTLGADFLGTWLSPVEFAKNFAKGRQAEKGKMSRLIAFESALSLTGSNADEYHPIKPGDELAVCLALAHEIIVKNQQSQYAGRTDITEALKAYSVDAVAEETGIDSQKLRATATALWKARGQGLVLGGPIKTKNAVALEVAVNLLNSALENDGATIDWSMAPSNQGDSSYAALRSLITEISQKMVGGLFIYNMNPLFNWPADLAFAAALKNIPLVVTFADRVNETAIESNFVLPIPHYLEAWNDASPQKGVFSIVQPVINPLYDTRPFQESLIKWGQLSIPSWYEYLRTNWSNQMHAPYGVSTSFDVFWEETLQKGVFDTHGNRSAEPMRLAATRSLLPTALSTLPSRETKDSYRLSLYPSVALFDGRSANNAWLQELPDPLSKITWDNYLSIAPKTATNLGLREGDVIHIKGEGIDAKLPIHIQPKMHEKTLMASVGYGHSKIGQVGNHVGVNTYPLQRATGQLPEWSALPLDSIEKTGVRERLATTQGHHTVEGRPLIHETTFAEFKQDPSSGNEQVAALPTLWPKHEYKGYRWGMAIDMNACIGCSSCMIACQSENNVPTVGKQQVLNGRDMHWLRIDRYYGGELDQPEMTYQPMLCQHCENAPCETVCPVIATLHNDEGLNVQVYNRCVGTRYCSNNCPYKVRRFNFFNFFADLREPQNLAFNPDVTVRSRGIMEKCNFCMQRIRTAKDHAKDEGRKVQDGDIKTACQQTCPTNAIIFGDTNDPNSLVSRFKKSPRGYHVLEDLNVLPQVTYLTKIRNKEVG